MSGQRGVDQRGVGLRVAGVHHAFGDLAVLDGLDFEVAAGEVTVIVGPSGCGKSTLLGILGGLVQPLRGQVLLQGTPAADCLNPLTFVFQDFALVPWRSVAANVALVLEDTKLSRADRERRVADMLALTGLSAFADAWPRQLSGGMRQRVGIARALAVRPAVLLMDEPLSALDAQTRGLLLEEFVALIARTGATTVYVTHNLSEAARLGQQILVMGRRPGRIRAVLRIHTPLSERRADDPALQTIERELWELLRADAADADREVLHAR
jgi:NitT/TauT family transport system ATP-binding protein